MLKTVVLLNIFVETVKHFSGVFDEVNFDYFNASLQNKCITNITDYKLHDVNCSY